jgi:hypothetical protein
MYENKRGKGSKRYIPPGTTRWITIFPGEPEGETRKKYIFATAPPLIYIF